MHFELTAEQRDWQMKARRFAQDEIRRISLARDQIQDAAATWDWNIIRKGSKLGFRTAAVPRQWGGHGIDFVTQALVMAELAKADSAISKAFSQNWKWSHLIAGACTDDQKRRFLTPFLADDTYVIGMGGTEPNAGSDNRYPPEDFPKAGLKLRAERRGDEWILNGEKTFIANGGVGKLFFAAARTNPDAPVQEGTTIFMVPIETPGFRIGKIFNKAGWRFYQNGELIFENARVPHANVLGEVNGGHKARSKGSAEFNDFELAANAVGVCDDACESALQFAKSSSRGGKRLFDHQLVQLKLGEMHTLTEALRSFTLRMAAEMDRSAHTQANVVFLMNFSCDVIQKVTALNMGIHASGGGAMDAHADKLVRDAIIWTHLAGDASQRLKAVRRLAGGTPRLSTELAPS
jgi:alkylation response protein AidB-like acyl-CoA dehydrogenase